MNPEHFTSLQGKGGDRIGFFQCAIQLVEGILQLRVWFYFCFLITLLDPKSHISANGTFGGVGHLKHGEAIS